MKKRQLLSVGILLAAALLAVVIWQGYRSDQEKYRALEVRLENQYQRNFLELAGEVDQIDIQLAQVLLSGNGEQSTLGLVNLWRSVYGAISSMSALPIAMEELQHTDALLRDIAEYSYYLMKRNIAKQNSLGQQDWEQLEEFYERTKVIRKELSGLEARILNEDLRFHTLAQAYEKQEDQQEHGILSGFRALENQIGGFPEIELAEGVRKIEPTPRPISGERITAEEAEKIAQIFYETAFAQERSAKVAFESQGIPIPVYGIILQKEGEEDAYVEVSCQGGHIMQMYRYRNAQAVDISAQQAQQDSEAAAKEFLQKQGFSQMAVVDEVMDDRYSDITLVAVQDGVYLYADMVKVLIALDQYDVISFDQSGFIANHYERTIESPQVTKEELIAHINPNFSLQKVRLAYITDEYTPGEYLTYELRGEIGQEAFAVFVDAKSGAQRKIIRLTKPNQYMFSIREET